ncbi:MAG: hypothetical protein ACI9CD_001208 [Candidatus Deianiraeaceae bacterium]|jgi:hypothetical protein
MSYTVLNKVLNPLVRPPTPTKEQYDEYDDLVHTLHRAFEYPQTVHFLHTYQS